jgi:dihydroflavonol-4-reductase
MAGAKKLGIGASGFLGSHVTRQLVDRGDDVRVLIRQTSSTKAIEDLDVEYHYGDIFDAAVDADLRRFVFTSTIGTIGIPAERRPATEEDEFNWANKGGAYVLSRVETEKLVMRYAKERGLPAVALCVSNTYGPRDWQPTPHGKQLALAAGPRSSFGRTDADRDAEGEKQVAHYACPQRVPA